MVEPPGTPRFPTQGVVREFIEITTSSSSSHVWKLGIGPRCAAQRAHDPVGPLWGGDRCPVVDMWTDRPPCTRVVGTPPPLPVPPPVRPPGMPRSTGRSTRYRGLERSCLGNVLVREGIDVRAGQFEARGRTFAGGRRSGRPAPGGNTISPTCAHSWGQLLDLSMQVTVRRVLTTRRHEPPSVHIVRSLPVDKSTR